MNDSDDLYDRAMYRSDDFLTGLVKSWNPRARKLRGLLRAYPIYSPPYLEENVSLSDSEALSNFQYFEQEKQNRIALVDDCLREFSIPLDFRSPNRHGLLLLDAWAYQHWKSIYDRKLAPMHTSGFSFTPVQARVRSFLFDISLFLGECYLSLDGDARWFLDDSESSRNDEMATCNRIVLWRPPHEDHFSNVSNLLDIEAHVYFHYAAQKNSIASLCVDQKIGRVLAEPILRLLADRGE